MFVLKNDSVVFTPIRDFLGTTSIFYVVKDSLGILSHPTEIIVTVVREQNGIFIPQGFSPNGDGTHDYFVIEGIETLDVSLTIYNRWGNVVFGDKHYKNNWDGSLNGAQDNNVLAASKIDGWGDESAPEGTYFYLVEFNNSSLENRNGYVIISR
jgi:gliding motility-associated-like protein